jgi:hypothetical protein
MQQEAVRCNVINMWLKAHGLHLHSGKCKFF